MSGGPASSSSTSVGILAQAAGEHAAGRPSSDDHVVGHERSLHLGDRPKLNCLAIPLPRLLATLAPHVRFRRE